MKAVAISPGKPNSAHLAELSIPRLEDVSSGRGVLVKVLRVGLDGTDREINAAEYGAAPPGIAFLPFRLAIGGQLTGTVEQLRGSDHRLQLATGRISAHLLDKLQDLPTIRLW